MAGHSKWSNIKNKKERSDAQRGKLFTKVGRQIAVAVKEGGSDPETNSRLRDAISNAKAANMPNENINRSIKRASGELGNVTYDEVIYEGYGPNGVAVIVHALTDNRNRAASEMRFIFDRGGGSLGETGCVSWMFDRKGLVVVEDSDQIDEEDLMMQALTEGAEDIYEEEGIFEILTDPQDFTKIRDALERAGYAIASSEITMLPQNIIKLDGDKYERALSMFEKLEDHDDVQSVFHNLELIEEN